MGSSSVLGMFCLLWCVIENIPPTGNFSKAIQGSTNNVKGDKTHSHCFPSDHLVIALPSTMLTDMQCCVCPKKAVNCKYSFQYISKSPLGLWYDHD